MFSEAWQLTANALFEIVLEHVCHAKILPSPRQPIVFSPVAPCWNRTMVFEKGQNPAVGRSCGGSPYGVGFGRWWQDTGLWRLRRPEAAEAWTPSAGTLVCSRSTR